MTELSAEQQQALEEQKAQCPFCKIIKGDIPSKKIFEDDKIMAVLDINPATKGHILVMPKEHYPIMPLIPEDVFEYLFTKTKELSKCVKEGAVVPATTIFIANGAAAGQQSNHFLLHIIPRDENDGLSKLEPVGISLEKEKVEETFKMLKNNLPIMLRTRYAKYALEGEAPASQPSPAPSGYTKEQIIDIIEKNPQLKKVIEEQPDAFRVQVKETPQLKQLFENVDIEDVLTHFKKEVKHSMEELIEVLNKNPQLKSMLLYEKDNFRIKIGEIEALKEIFGNVNVDELQHLVIQNEKTKAEGELEESKNDDVNEISADDENDVLDALGAGKEVEEEIEEIEEEKEEPEPEKEPKEEEKKPKKKGHGDPGLDDIANMF